MKTWPEVSVSRPARQCISVDLPEPDGPMIAVKRPVEVDGHAVEGADLVVAVAVDLDGVDGAGRGRGGGRGREVRGGETGHARHHRSRRGRDRATWARDGRPATV